MNEFVNSDGQWLLSFYKIVTQLLTYSVTLVPPGQCAAKQPLTTTDKLTCFKIRIWQSAFKRRRQ